MFEKCVEYGLHDTTVNDILIEEYGLTLLFRDGVYLLNDEGKETRLSKSCAMHVYVEDFDSARLFEHCSFYKYHKNRFSEIEFADIKKLLLKNSFHVDLDFYSPFARAILIRGYIGKYMIEVQISEVKSIEFET